KPICDLIECFFCWENVFNLHCWTTTEIVITATVSFLSLIACRLISPALKCFWWLLKKLFRLLQRLTGEINPCRTRHDKYVIPHFPSYKRTVSQRLIRKTPIMTLVLHLVCPSNACSDVVSISGTVQHCKVNSTNEQCEFDEAVTLQMQHVGQDVCLLLRNYKNEPAGVISLRIHDIAYSCQERTEYYTRDHKFYTESHHQCWNTQSCTGETCRGITTSTNIYEFSHYAKNNPGYTYCSPSCKMLMETCLFYKVYAWPKSKTIYRIFTCPVWSITITGTITLRTSTKDEEHNFILNPARPHVWNSIELTLTATTVPNLPICVKAYFLTDGSPRTTPMQSERGHLVEKFSSCQFSPATCQCNPLVYEATCNCPAGNISKHLNNAHQQLPLSGKDVVILQRGNSIQAKTTSGSSTSIQISIHGLSIFTKRVKNECRVDMGSLTGCYSCFQGAHVQVSCTSTLSEETAEIHCKNQTQIVKCSPHGIISDTVFHFATSSLDINCSVLLRPAIDNSSPRNA
ncbi:hypothetical protein OSTOST_01960, partial [Ostertagia ostertagi]